MKNTISSLQILIKFVGILSAIAMFGAMVHYFMMEPTLLSDFYKIPHPASGKILAYDIKSTVAYVDKHQYNELYVGKIVICLGFIISAASVAIDAFLRRVRNKLHPGPL